MYGILTTPDVGEEDFFDIALFLERADSGSTALKAALAGSPHRNTPSAAVVKARSAGFSDYLDALVICSAQNPLHRRPWIEDKVNDFVRQLSTALLEEEVKKVSIFFAFKMLRNGLNCSNFLRIGFRFLLMSRIHILLEEKAQPSEDFFRWHNEASRAIRYDGSLTTEEKKVLRRMRDEAGNKLGVLTHLALIDHYPAVEQAANQIIQRMSGFLNRLTADKAAVGSVAGNVISVCQEAIRDYERAIPVVTDSDIRKSMTDVMGYFQQVLQRMNDYR
jgi:hypothetical protein